MYMKAANRFCHRLDILILLRGIHGLTQLAMFGALISSGTSYLGILVYGVARVAAGIAILGIAAIATLVIITVPVQLHRISFAPKNIPWVGQKEYTWCSKLRSTLVASKFERSNLEEGWEKVCP